MNLFYRIAFCLSHKCLVQISGQKWENENKGCQDFFASLSLTHACIHTHTFSYSHAHTLSHTHTLQSLSLAHCFLYLSPFQCINHEFSVFFSAKNWKRNWINIRSRKKLFFFPTWCISTFFSSLSHFLFSDLHWLTSLPFCWLYCIRLFAQLKNNLTLAFHFFRFNIDIFFEAKFIESLYFSSLSLVATLMYAFSALYFGSTYVGLLNRHKT